MYSILPLFKSHFSLGKSILTLEKPTGKLDSYPVSIFDLLIGNNISTLMMVEDNISGLLQAAKNAKENKINLIFGLRLYVYDDVSVKDESVFKKRAKYIIFAKNSKGYESLIKIWSFAATTGFYYSPHIDFKTLQSFWNDDLILSIPFYDSFLYLNTFCSHVHVPKLDVFGKITFFVEDNELPFDDFLHERVIQFCDSNHFDMVPAQSIFYKTKEDFLAYLAFRCLSNRESLQKCTLERPELDHMSSDEFNFEKWLVRIRT
jgi:DNA polymerase III alpha subunit